MKVTYNAEACCHSGNCVKTLPEVFAVENGQFVARPENAPAERVLEVVAACPAKALTVEE